MGLSDLKDLFFILGVLVSIVFVLGIIMISVIKLHDFIAECIYAKRYEYMIKHRFDDPPSGDLTPSEADIDAAIKIDEVGQLIYTPMKDFMVIGSETYYSVKENEDI